MIWLVFVESLLVVVSVGLVIASPSSSNECIIFLLTDYLCQVILLILD